MEQGRTSSPSGCGVGGDTQLAGEIKALLASGDRDAACERFSELVRRHQRRATRIAYYYLRDAADIDEAVQDAFLKVFLRLSSFREELLFELWFTRIVVNSCLDRLRARTRRGRWLTSVGDNERALVEQRPTAGASPEVALLSEERRARLAVAIEQLPPRQRAVVILSQFEGHSTREVGTILGTNDATVRVHLFRAIRSLRKRLRRKEWLTNRTARAAAARQA